MRICPICQKQVTEDALFCPTCGAKLEIPQPEPVAEPQPEPVVAPQAVSATRSIPKAIIGLALSATALYMALIGFIYSIAVIALPYTGFVFALIMSIFCIALPIVGLILTKKSETSGTMAKLSRIFAYVSFGFTALMCLLGSINMILSMTRTISFY